jgi:hypothetical protein
LNQKFPRTQVLFSIGTGDKSASSFGITETKLFGFQPDLTLGVEALDETLVLRSGQLITFFGTAARSLAFLFCVRATLPKPLGPDSDVVFADGGNLFDPYFIATCSIEHELNAEDVLERILISRAFTYHQLSSLIMDRLPVALDESKAKLTVISDITLLFCDSDIRGQDRRDAMHIFHKNVRFLAALAEQKNILILISDLQARNPQMRTVLKENSHICAEVDGRGSFIQLNLLRHPWNPPVRKIVSVTGNPTLDRYV